MRITERQKLILDKVIEEYVDSANPVSSKLLEKKYHFGICPATIRNEMQTLTEGGYLYQPHTSAGRVPTDKGYRFLVDDLLEEDFSYSDQKFYKEFSQIEREVKDSLKFIHLLTKKVAEITSNLTVSYLEKEGLVLKEGWRELIKEPEFRNPDYFSKFIEMMESWEDDIEDYETSPKIRIFIGKENPLPEARDFSIIVSPCSFTKGQDGILAIIGPKRMAYSKNINLIKSLTRFLTE